MANIAAEFTSSIAGLFKVGAADVPGLIVAVLLAKSSELIAASSFVAPLGEIGKSAQLWAILVGMLYGNVLHSQISQPKQGLAFSKKNLLQIGVILYGFKVTFQQLRSVGISALVIDLMVMSSTSLLSYYVGAKVLGMDAESSLLAGCGSSICGVSAVLAAEPVVKAKPHQTSTAVATMVIFGTITMFMYPAMRGMIPLDDRTYGVYTGGTLQDMAGVVTAGKMMSEEIAAAAVITKLARVMLLGPYLVILSTMMKRTDKGKVKVSVPWFAVAFVLVAAVNSLSVIPASVVKILTKSSAFMLLSAMVALGVDTNISKVKAAGVKPLLLGGILCVHLVVSGFLMTKVVVGFLG